MWRGSFHRGKKVGVMSPLHVKKPRVRCNNQKESMDKDEDDNNEDNNNDDMTMTTMR